MPIHNRVSGQSPHTDGLQITVTCPDATKENPIRKGDSLNFRTDGPYLAQIAPQGALIYMKALHSVNDAQTPLAVQLFGFSRIQKFRYMLAEPNFPDIKIGYIVMTGLDGKVLSRFLAQEPFQTGNIVLFIDEENEICEVAMR